MTGDPIKIKRRTKENMGTSPYWSMSIVIVSHLSTMKLNQIAKKFKMKESRRYIIERLVGDGELEELQKVLELNHTQRELDIALENAITYSQISTAEYLLSIGADFSNYDYQEENYAVDNDEFEGVKFSIAKGVDVNVNKGMFLNTCIINAINSKSIVMVKWLIDNGANTKYLTEDSLKDVNDFGSEELKELIKNAI